MPLVARRSFLTASVLALGSALGLAGCSDDGPPSQSDDITDVPHTDVERQSIGNCWLYATASWAESMNLTATGQAFDVSQSYWTYWHWYWQLWGTEADAIETGGTSWTANRIIERRGLMAEADFVGEDAAAEMSSRQKEALEFVNRELREGRLADPSARFDRVLLRDVLDEAWQLSDEVRGELDAVFGEDGDRTLEADDGIAAGSRIVPGRAFPVRYASREPETGETRLVDATLLDAIGEWREARYPSFGDDPSALRRSFQIRVQRALHDRQPVIITWDVDFNAMEGSDPELLGSFNLATLARAGGPGLQGGHMTVLEDYEAVTEQYGLLEAGETLDPSDPEQAAKLEAALLPSTEIRFFRVKNSWGALRDDRTSAPGFPGYHDLHMDYLNGPISWCPHVEGPKTNENCVRTTTPWTSVVLPPGY